MSFTKTCVTSLQHIPGNLPNDNFQSEIPVIIVVLLPNYGPDGADPGSTQIEALVLDRDCAVELSPKTLITDINLLQIVRVNWIQRLKSEPHIAKQEVQKTDSFSGLVWSWLLPRTISMPRLYWFIWLKRTHVIWISLVRDQCFWPAVSSLQDHITLSDHVTAAAWPQNNWCIFILPNR